VCRLDTCSATVAGKGGGSRSPHLDDAAARAQPFGSFFGSPRTYPSAVQKVAGKGQSALRDGPTEPTRTRSPCEERLGSFPLTESCAAAGEELSRAHGDGRKGRTAAEYRDVKERMSRLGRLLLVPSRSNRSRGICIWSAGPDAPIPQRPCPDYFIHIWPLTSHESQLLHLPLRSQKFNRPTARPLKSGDRASDRFDHARKITVNRDPPEHFGHATRKNRQQLRYV
jgi:hypothetical protein